MKKIIVLLLAVLMVVSLVACDLGGNGDNPGNTDNPGTSQGGEDNPGGNNDNPGGNTDTPGDNVSFSTDWYTKPFHIKGMTYDGTEPDEELEILYDGQALIIWQGEDGRYIYFADGKLMDMVIFREDGYVSKRMESEAYYSTMLDYMKGKADFLAEMIDYINYLSDYTNAGSETVSGIECVKYESKKEDMLGNRYTFWIDKATGVFVKMQTSQTLNYDGTKLENPNIVIGYVMDSISVTNVPSISSLYEMPTE